MCETVAWVAQKDRLMRLSGAVWILACCIVTQACTPLYTVPAKTAPHDGLQGAVRVKPTEVKSQDAQHPVLFSIEGESDESKLNELRKMEEIPRVSNPVVPFNIPARK